MSRMSITVRGAYNLSRAQSRYLDMDFFMSIALPSIRSYCAASRHMHLNGVSERLTVSMFPEAPWQ